MAEIKKTTNKLDFENELWDAACELWGHIPAAEYRKVKTVDVEERKLLG